MYEDQLKEIKSELREYVELQKQRLKLRSVELLSAYIVEMLLVLSAALLVLLVLLFGSFALSHYLNTVLYSEYQGFLIVSGLYLILFILGYLFRGPIFHSTLRNKIIRKIVEQLKQEKS